MRRVVDGSSAKHESSDEDDSSVACIATSKKVSVVSHGEISHFVVGVVASEVQSPNKALEPTIRSVTPRATSGVSK
jgi:hypothetical protein